jgi:hypothetical protein
VHSEPFTGFDIESRRQQTHLSGSELLEELLVSSNVAPVLPPKKRPARPSKKAAAANSAADPDEFDL